MGYQWVSLAVTSPGNEGIGLTRPIIQGYRVVSTGYLIGLLISVEARAICIYWLTCIVNLIVHPYRD